MNGWPLLFARHLVAGGIALGNPELRERAMAELHSKYELHGKQQLINVSEEFHSGGFVFFYWVVSLTVTADVIEFIDSEPEGRK